MKNIVKLALIVSGLSILLLGSTNLVRATDGAEQSAEQSQTIKVTCTSGAYGQDTNCTAEGSQSQKLHQIISYTRVLGASKIHTPVDTAVDPGAMLAIFATGLTGIGAFLGYTRLK